MTEFLRRCVVGWALLLVLLPAQAADLDGETTLWLNQGVLAPLGLSLSAEQADTGTAAGTDAGYRELRFALAAGQALRWRREHGRFAALETGSIGHVGGFVLGLPDGTELDLRGFRLQQRGTARIGLELADARGTAWFTLDHAHHFVEAGDVLAIRHLDLRIGAALAQRIGRPEWQGMLLGGAQTRGSRIAAAAAVVDVPEAKGSASCPVDWPSATAAADVQMLRLALNWEERQPDGVNAYRCGRRDAAGAHTQRCTADSSDGLVVLAPDASLRNAGTASVAWYAKFSPPAPPYANDQHPFLVWNLYRLDADGSLRQIGVSAAKHAFHTINAACDCAEGNVLYPGCEDTYGGFSNDYSSALAPRSEIVPYGARWGRCGSLYDANCDGRQDAGGGLLPDDAYHADKRLGVRERELMAALHPGARWFLEYWYVVRDDVDPWNNIGLMEVVPAKVRAQGADADAYIWRFEVSDFRNGSMLQRWLAQAPAGGWQRSAIVQTEQGRAQLGTRVTPLASGRFRYEYQLFNLDLMLARTSGAEPDLRVEENLGIERFAVFADPAAALDSLEFAAVADSGAQWSALRDEARVTWSRGTAPALDWGRSFRFSFVSDLPPRDSTAHLGMREQIWHAATLAPLRDWAPRPRVRPVPTTD